MKLKSLGLVSLGAVVGFAGSLQLSAVAQKVPDSSLPLDELRQLTDVFGLIKSDYVEPVEDRKLLSEAIAGMVSSLDPHSVYLDQKAFREMKESMEGKFVGLGIEVAMEDGYVKIITPIEDSPAFRAGIKPGDLITRIDNTPIKGLSLDEAIKKMRGEPNSQVVLTIARKGEDAPWVVPLTREEIRVQSVKGKVIEPGYAWVRISQFQEQTLDDLGKKLAAIHAQDPKLKGLVLDLRNDPGGLLPGAVGASAAFLPYGKEIVSTRGQLPDQNQVFYGRREFYVTRSTGDPLARVPAVFKSVPMVVLVNTGSASASEIVAGALQDYKRAVVMGTTTFGKGSVQTLRPLTADTAVKLTTARYYTPNKRPIQAKGIEPDLRVNESADGQDINSLLVREADLPRHLTQARGQQDEPAAKRDERETEQRALALAKRRKPIDFGSKDDFQLQQALNHLKGQPVMLARAETDADAATDAGALKDKGSPLGSPLGTPPAAQPEKVPADLDQTPRK